ncbi:MAG: ABC transporter permease [Cyclobacteriaceae bacterium]
MIKRFADIFFRWYCRKDYYPDIRGDLEENYLKHRKKYSKRFSDLLFLKEVFMLFRPSIIQPGLNFLFSTNQSAMLKNYIKIAFRNLQRQKAYTAVNVLGLSIGITSLFFILIFIESELSYDKHHKDGDRLYRVSTHGTVNGESVTMITSPPGLKDRVLADMPEIEASTRIVSFLGISKNIMRLDDKTITETRGYLADPNFFEIFNYPILYGSRQSMLEQPQSLVLSKTLADKLFKETDPTGTTITVVNDYGTSDYAVTGVYDDRDINSHLNPAFVCSMNSGAIGKYVFGNDRLVGNNFLFTYVKLRPGTNATESANKIQGLIGNHVENPENAHGYVPVADIYLHSSSPNGENIGGDIRYIYILITIAILILAIACINFANMATAQASKRAKEIGVRKTFGALNRMIVMQFLGESLAITLLSLIVSIAAIFLLAPSYASFTGKEIHALLILEKVGFLIAIGLLTSLLAGSYPSFYLSSLKLKNILGGRSSNSTGSFIVRKVLVVFQFVVGILLIVGSMTTAKQLNFIQSKPLGFNSTNQLVIPLQSEEVITQLTKVKSTFLNIPGVHAGAGTTYTPAQFVLSDNLFRASPSQPDEEGIIIRQNDVDFGLIEVLGIEVVAGRTFDENISAEVDRSIVVNEAAVRALGLTNESILNRDIYTEERDGVVAYNVIGVVSDFHSRSLHRPIDPYLFAMRPGNNVSSVIVKIDADNYQRTISALENRWDSLFPTLPFEFYFLDQQLMAQYESDQKFGQIINLFTTVALMLCLIGIFGLTSFTVQQSLKEISIRKVLGASISNIYSSFALKFLLLVGIAALISVPIGMIVMNRWLELFAYHITLGISTALIPILIIITSSLAVISYKLFFAARVNPTVILRGD